MTLWPRSLAARTAFVLLVGLVIVQAAGLTIHALDRLDLQRFSQTRDIAIRVLSIYRPVIGLAAPDHNLDMRENGGEIWMPPGYIAILSPFPPLTDLPFADPNMQALMRVSLNLSPIPGPLRPRQIRIHGGLEYGRVVIGLELPRGGWLDVQAPIEPMRPWHYPGFLIAFVVMSLAAAALTLWAVRRLTLPVRTLALAAEALGRDVNAPPLPEDGPLEVATAAAAFNTMASRIRRFVADRTEMLTAIGHDLRTPITRLKLRAEFMDDDEQRRKMLADLDELEAMVSATLAFGRDAATSEPVVSLDLAELLQTILDEASDAQPPAEGGLTQDTPADVLKYDGPPHLAVRARSLSLKRALTNLIGNAVAYGGGAHVRLTPDPKLLTIDIDDPGPGIAPEELDRVFEPFRRLETSRNRETGGVGLGLPIARNILRAHGGDVTLTNRPEGGLRAHVTLPA